MLICDNVSSFQSFIDITPLNDAYCSTSTYHVVTDIERIVKGCFTRANDTDQRNQK